MSKTKILYISHTSRTAGAERCLVTLIRHLDKEKFEPVVVLPVKGALTDEFAALGVRTIMSELEWWARVPRTYGLIGSDIYTRVKALVKIIAEERPAIVHTNTSVIWEGALAARLAGIPHIWHLHEKLAGHPSLRTLLPLPVAYGLMDLLSTRVVAVSEAVRSQVSGPITATKVCVVQNGVPPLQRGSFDGQAFRSELGIADDAAIAVSVGALIPEKDYGTLLEAAVLATREVNVHFVIIGGGEPDAIRRFNELVLQRGLSGRVHYIGYRSDVPKILAGADLLVVSSSSEAFSLVVLEAMSAGKPVVATDCGGPREIIVDFETGFLVPVGDHSALAKGVVALATDKMLARKLGEQGAQRFNDFFTASHFAHRFAAIYAGVTEAEPTLALHKSERIFLQGIMDTYQRISCNELQAGITFELRNLVKRSIGAVFKPVQWAVDRKKRKKR